MIKKLTQLLTIMVIMAFAVALTIRLVSPKINNLPTNNEANQKIKIVTTIYPVYMIGLNIGNQIDNIEVKSLTKMNTGCLHDYQLTTKDMKLIATADVLVINGGGMEAFIEDVKTNYPNLKIIDASQGISMLHGHEEEHKDEHAKDGEHIDDVQELNHNESSNQDNQEEIGEDSKIKESDNHEEEDHHDHGEYNAHVWLDPKLYISQIETVKNGLIEYIHENTNKTYAISLITAIEKNAEAYIKKVQDLDQQIEQCSKNYKSNTKQEENGVVIFHDSFAYLAKRIGMEVAFAIDLDSDTSLSAGEVASIIDVVKRDGITHLFTEQQFSDSIARQIGQETGAKVTIIDSAVTGDGNLKSYINSMKRNIEILSGIK